jgi:putative sugar O-methyltransferase
MSDTQEIADDPVLLELMMNDLAAADPIFQPTRYWREYQDRTVTAIRDHGLSGLRGRRDAAFTSFGCYEGNLLPSPEALELGGLSQGEHDAVWEFLAIAQRHQNLELLPLNLSLSDLMRGHLADLDHDARIQNANAKSIFELDCSLAGGPSVHFRVAGKSYTPSMIQAYRAYGQCMREIDLTDVDCIVEIGAGMGQQVELSRKLHPHLAYVVLDLPPQLYVSHQYLSVALGDACVPYAETRGSGPVEIEPGRVYFLGNWRVDDVRPPGQAMLWNAKSFQEMSQPVVTRYYQAFSSYCDFLHLRNLRRGLEPEMIEAMRLEKAIDKDFYDQLFDPAYEQIAYRRPRKLAEDRGYRIMSWRRRGLVTE